MYADPDSFAYAQSVFEKLHVFSFQRYARYFVIKILHTTLKDSVEYAFRSCLMSHRAIGQTGNGDRSHLVLRGTVDARRRPPRIVPGNDPVRNPSPSGQLDGLFRKFILKDVNDPLALSLVQQGLETLARECLRRAYDLDVRIPPVVVFDDVLNVHVTRAKRLRD